MTVGSSSGIAWIATSAWAYPALESLHIVGIALLLGNLVLFEARVWGAASELPLRSLARLSLGLAAGGFGLAALTGIAMFSSQPGELLANRAFVIKMTLLMLAGLNAAFFHARGSLDAPDATARALTLISLGLWLAVIACGRWIAYV
ncbi:MAG TPA: hypothetical protein VFR90_02350 [Methylibium sp.]|uniref:hypothetical protein n=1 Tax=Methylibium sp. TaxID=2067992 RepID=UPI002DB76916|nr:hypothetical protein [Methylibium sp.]HEU4457943.1 hypothetical protein [Methylibium sp.]